MDYNSLENDMDGQNITKKQKEILKFVNKEVQKKGYPPSVREICKAVGFRSTSTVHSHLEKLTKMGYLYKDPSKPRALRVINYPENKIVGGPSSSLSYKELVNVPIVGKVTAGQPILAVENIEDTFPVPVEIAKNGDVFFLRVQGESMINAGILDGDMVLVRQQNFAENGEIVVAIISDEATIKTFYREKNYVRLQPENPNMDPIIVKNNLSVLGKVIGVFRIF